MTNHTHGGIDVSTGAIVATPDHTNETPEFLTPGEASALTRYSVPALARMRGNGDGPPFIAATNRKILYRRASVLAWLSAFERTEIEK